MAILKCDAHFFISLLERDKRVSPFYLDTVLLSHLDDHPMESRPLDTFHLVSKPILLFYAEVAVPESGLFLGNPRSGDHLVDPLTWNLIHVKSGDEREHTKAVGLQPASG